VPALWTSIQPTGRRTAHPQVRQHDAQQTPEWSPAEEALNDDWESVLADLWLITVNMPILLLVIKKFDD